MDEFYWGILLAARIAPVVFLVPAFAGRRLPIPAKLGLVAMISMVAYPHAGALGPVPGTLRFIGLLLKELSVGTVLALAAACLFEGIKMGGQLVDHLRGASNSEVSVPHPSSPRAARHCFSRHW
jgi:type III secretion protein T